VESTKLKGNLFYSLLYPSSSSSVLSAPPPLPGENPFYLMIMALMWVHGASSLFALHSGTEWTKLGTRRVPGDEDSTWGRQGHDRGQVRGL